MDETIQVVHVPELSRYELKRGIERIGHADAIQKGDVVVVPHVEVDRAYEGHGYGSRLVREMLDDIRRKGRKVQALCPFVATFLRRFPEYAELQG